MSSIIPDDLLPEGWFWYEICTQDADLWKLTCPNGPNANHHVSGYLYDYAPLLGPMWVYRSPHYASTCPDCEIEPCSVHPSYSEYMIRTYSIKESYVCAYFGTDPVVYIHEKQQIFRAHPCPDPDIPFPPKIPSYSYSDEWTKYDDDPFDCAAVGGSIESAYINCTDRFRCKYTTFEDQCGNFDKDGSYGVGFQINPCTEPIIGVASAVASQETIAIGVNPCRYDISKGEFTSLTISIVSERFKNLWGYYLSGIYSVHANGELLWSGSTPPSGDFSYTLPEPHESFKISFSVSYKPSQMDFQHLRNPESSDKQIQECALPEALSSPYDNVTMIFPESISDGLSNIVAYGSTTASKTFILCPEDGYGSECPENIDTCCDFAPKDFISWAEGWKNV